MRVKPAVRVAAAALLAACACAKASASLAPAPGVEQAQAAVRLLREAAAALGGEARLRDAQSLRTDYRGRLYWIHQGRTPAEPMTFVFGQQGHFDWAGRQLLAMLEFEGPESAFRRRLAFDEEPGHPNLVEAAALSPHAIVRHWLARPADLLLLRDDESGARLAGPLHGRIVILDLAPDRLPRSLGLFYDDGVAGDSVRLVEYGDYREMAGWRAPARVRQLEAGSVTMDLELAGFEVDAARPAWAEGLAPQPAAAEDGREERLEAIPLAEGIHLLRGHGGSDYHGMLVELDEGLMVLETPAAIGDGSELRAVAAALSSKPIVFAVPTHHHDDHSAGAAPLARDGATILTTAGNVAFFRRMVSSLRRLSGHPGGAGTPRVRALAPDERIGPVRFLDIGSLDHAAEHLVFWLPEQRILFQSDMGRFNPDGSVEPAREQTCALLAFIDRGGLPVDRIVGGHGRIGTMDDLRRAAAHRDPPCGEGAA